MTSKKNGTIDRLSLLKGKKPREGTHTVVLDHEAVEAFGRARARLTAAQSELRRARRLGEADATMAELQADVEEAQAEVDDLESTAADGVGTVLVKLHAMPPLAYAALKAEFPPNEADHDEVRRESDDDTAKAAWNQTEFAPRLLAACVVDPDISEDDARGFFEAWTRPEWYMLVNACRNLHERAVDTSSLVFSSARTRS